MLQPTNLFDCTGTAVHCIASSMQQKGKFSNGEAASNYVCLTLFGINSDHKKCCHLAEHFDSCIGLSYVNPPSLLAWWSWLDTLPPASTQVSPPRYHSHKGELYHPQIVQMLKKTFFRVSLSSSPMTFLTTYFTFWLISLEFIDGYRWGWGVLTVNVNRMLPR